MAINLLIFFFLVSNLENAVSGKGKCENGGNSSNDIPSEQQMKQFETRVRNNEESDKIRHCAGPLLPQNTPYLSEEMPECSLPWSYCDNGTCKCGRGTQGIKCHPDRTLVNTGFCATFNDDTALTEVGRCMYNGVIDQNERNNSLYVTLPNVTELTEFTCGYLKRNGTLCGRCEDDHYPLAYSVDMTCVRCPNGRSNWWKFVLAAFLPLTLFYFVVLLFRVNVTSSHLHGFVYCSQGIAIPSLIRVILLYLRNNRKVELAVRCIGTIYGIWNLDFLRFINLDICLPTSTLTTLTLDLAVGVYPLLLMLITYILIELYERNFRPLVIIWKPFGAIFGLFNRNWDIRTSLIDAFTTFFFLSTIKFMSVSFDLLIPVHLRRLDSAGQINNSWHLYYDPTVPYFGGRHLPYAVLAIVVFVLFSVLPAMLLLLYPFAWFQKLLNFIPVRRHVLRTFMDSFQGCYKDGTQPGTRDCRWFASVFYLSRIFILLIGGFTLNSMFFPIVLILLTLISLLLATVQPFKTSVSHYANINTIFVVLLAVFYTAILGTVEARTVQMEFMFITIGQIAALLPLLYLTAIIVHWLYSHRKFGLDLIRTLRAWRHGYQILH